MRIRSIEWITAVLLSLVIAVLLFVRAQNAGALWRDECASLQLAEMPHVGDVLHNFQRESFPAPFPLTIRAYTAIFGTSDAALRAFGLVVGLMLLTVLWFNALFLRTGPPLLGAALLGLNTCFLIWGTSIRGYGLGSVLILLAFALVAKMLVEPQRFWVGAAALACLAAVQFLLYNSVLLVAIGLAGLMVCLFRQNLRAGIVLAGICALCALATLPYLGPFQYESRSTIVFQAPVDFAWLLEQISLACGRPTGVMTTAWVALFIAATGGAIFRIYLLREKRPFPEWDYLLYGSIVALAGPVLYLAFLKIIGYRTREWYYLALLTIIAGTIDLLVSNLARIHWIRIARLVLVIFALLGLPGAVWSRIVTRQSNMDTVAHKLAASAQPNDLIVVNPWFLGVGFNWYYAGKTPWTTCPSFADHRMHRFDLLKEKMATINPIDDVIGEIRRTLQSGKRVWLVGEVTILPPDRMAVTLLPAPQSEYGWSGDAYTETWSQQLGDLLRAHAGEVQFLEVTEGRPVSELENVPVFVTRGWHD
jgi:hypothetical protein